MVIEDQLIAVQITRRNQKHYQDLGYKDAQIDDIINIKHQHLSTGSKVKVDVKCDYCGKIVKVAYRDYVRYEYDKYSCARCRQKKTSEYNLSQRQNDLYNKAIDMCKAFGYELLTPKEYITTTESRVRYKCSKHGECETKVYTLILGHGCTHCSHEENATKARKSPDEVYDEFLQYGGVLLNKNEYIGWNYKNLQVVCKECGETFTTSYSSFMIRDGQRCPKCSSNISRGENEIRRILEQRGIEFTMQHRFEDCRTTIPLPFDFYLPQYNTCIEYDGEGHYLPIPRGGISDEEASNVLDGIKHRDIIKSTYCKDHNIDLIRIPYWEFANIEEILNTNLIT